MMTDATRDAAQISRRAMLATGGAGGALLLAACTAPGASTGGGSGGDASGGSDGGTGGGSSGSAAPGSLAPGTELGSLAGIPVGGSVSATVDGVPLVLAQPTAGTVVAFSAICTHQGCVVAAAGPEFDCPCHGSRYDAATGAVLQGPAPDPLPPVPIEVEGDRVVVGTA